MLISHTYCNAKLNDIKLNIKIDKVELKKGQEDTPYPSAIGGFLQRNCPYKSVAILILNDAGLAAIPYTRRKIFPHRGSNQRRMLYTYLGHNALNRVII